MCDMVRNRCIFLFVGMCLFGIPPAKGQTTWTKYDNTISPASDGVCTNGKIALGTSGSGDDWWANRPTVIKDNGVYKMWYTGYDGNAQLTVSVYYATSPDGLTWTKLNNNTPANSDTTSTDGHIPLGASGGDTEHALAPRVVRVREGDSYKYKMWYAGRAGAMFRLYHATAPEPPPPAGTVFYFR